MKKHSSEVIEFSRFAEQWDNSAMFGRSKAAAVLAIAATALTGGRAHTAAVQATSADLRFHHAHYSVGDPSAAMSEAARRLEGVRVIVQGLGVGVRAGREFLLFDRLSAAQPHHRPWSASQAYPRALESLRRIGLIAEPQDPSQSRVAGAMGGLAIDHLAFVAADFAAVVQRVLAAGAIVVARRDDSLLFDAGDGLMLEIVRDTDREETYWCPMHPDVRSADAGKCPICGMALVPIPPPKIGEFNVDVVQMRDHTGATIGLTLTVHEPDSNALVTKFSLAHEKLLHLFIVSRDLEYFAHVHPEPERDGVFKLMQPLPAGEYMLIADFIPDGGTPQMVQKAIIAGGSVSAIKRRVDSNGLKVTMKVDGELAAGKYAKLTFTVNDASTGAPVTNLQPYLGAPAHMLLVRGDLSDAIHAHPEELVSPGPSVSFQPLIPATGGYRLWIQFQRGGQISTSAFDLSVGK
jgi:hypothetical protein